MISQTEDIKVADRAHDWVERFLPRAMRPYARLSRLDRPIGTWLLLLPCWWSVSMATLAQGGGVPSLWYLLLFAIGAIAMRGAGCTYNDIVDRDFDAKVARSQSRPIPSGQVSVAQAWAFLVAQCLTGLVVLLQFNSFAIMVGLGSLLIVAAYPFMKRITYWPQFVLGLAFNWGALMGWAVVLGEISLPAVLLYVGGILWTLAYDTIYAHQDKEDDVMIGLKSTALKFGETTGTWLTGFFAAALVFIAAAAVSAGAGPIFFVGLAAAGAHAVWQLRTLDIDNSDVCLMLFRSNRNMGLLIFAAFTVDAML